MSRAREIADLGRGGTAGQIIQVRHTQMTDQLEFPQSADIYRTVVPNLFVDIRPSSTTNKVIVFAQLAVGFSTTPEWSWFVDREVSNTSGDVWVTQGASTTADSMTESTRALLGTKSSAGGQMYGYHGGPCDGAMNSTTDDIYSYSNVLYDTPSTTNICRYQVNLQNLWSGVTTIYVNRSGNNANTGYTTSGSSAITAMEVIA